MKREQLEMRKAKAQASLDAVNARKGSLREAAPFLFELDDVRALLRGMDIAEAQEAERTVDPKPGTFAHTARLMAQDERHLPEGDRTDWDAWKENMKEGGA